MTSSTETLSRTGFSLSGRPARIKAHANAISHRARLLLLASSLPLPRLRSSLLPMFRPTALTSLRGRLVTAPPAAASPSRIALASLRTSARTHAFAKPTMALRAANPQSGKPASDNLKHTVQNLKEEAGQVRSTLERAVAGSKERDHSGVKDDSDDVSGTSQLLSEARSITGEMAMRVPQPALVWGFAGVLPYIGTAGASVWLSRQAHRVSQGLDASLDLEAANALLLHAENIQIAYGAIILSFLGAIHWGFEWAKLGGRVGHVRYAMGVAPLMAAWPTLLFAPEMALIAQFAGYVGVWFMDLRATSQGWAPRWYSTYRFWLTAAVGSSIILTLAGTNYYDVSPSRSTQRGAGAKLAANVAADAKQKAEEIRASAQGEKGTKPIEGKVGGDVIASKGGEDSDSFVKLDNPKKRKEEEEKKKKEEEEKKKKEEEEQKKKKEEEAQQAKEKKDEGGDDKKKQGDGEQKEGDESKDEGKEGEKKDEGKDGEGEGKDGGKEGESKDE